jgi:hypothetical protein
VAALNTVLGRWGLRASSAWNISGEPCSGVAADTTTDVDNNPSINPAIKCDCTYNASTVCHITKLCVPFLLLALCVCSLSAQPLQLHCTPRARQNTYLGLASLAPCLSVYLSTGVLSRLHIWFFALSEGFF